MQRGVAKETAWTAAGGKEPEVDVMPELQNRIALRAYKLFAFGHDVENWLRAEQEVLSDDWE
jgi:hypothetical protein